MFGDALLHHLPSKSRLCEVQVYRIATLQEALKKRGIGLN